MKLVVEISEDIYKTLKTVSNIVYGFRSGKTFVHACLTAIRNGIPLDDVKAEMQKRADDPWNMTVGSASQGLKDAIEILDNIGETESEE